MEEKMRLQKAMAQLGFCSRRTAEEWIEAGRVYVNGQKVTTLGTQVFLSDTIHVEGEAQKTAVEKTVTFLFHKPLGVVSTVTDDRGRKTVVSFFEKEQLRLYPVGRLDYNTSGALFVSNDGELSALITHPSSHLEKTYIVTIFEAFRYEDKVKLENGILLEDGMTAEAKVKVLSIQPERSILQITIHEGRNRQVRRMFSALNYTVKYLHRESIGGIPVSSIERGTYKKLTDATVARLKAMCLERKANNQIPDYKKK